MMNFLKKTFVTSILAMTSLAAFSQTPPEGCLPDGVVFKNNNLILNPDKSAHRVFLIENMTAGNVVLNNYNPAQIGAMGSAGWTSKLDSHHWSALAMNQANFHMTCQGFNPPYYRLMDCKNAISVCSYPVKDSVGSFWVLENNSIINIIKTLKQRNLID